MGLNSSGLNSLEVISYLNSLGGNLLGLISSVVKSLDVNSYLNSLGGSSLGLTSWPAKSSAMNFFLEKGTYENTCLLVTRPQKHCKHDLKVFRKGAPTPVPPSFPSEVLLGRHPISWARPTSFAASLVSLPTGRYQNADNNGFTSFLKRGK